jgi:hypothetical protein
MKIKNTFLLFLSCLLFFSSYSQENIKLITTETQFIAGETIVLDFASNLEKKFQLYCTNSYGTTLLNAEIKNSKLRYTIPLYITSKRGIVNWKLLAKEKPISGMLTIIPNIKPVALETYVGPTSIDAGGKNFTMFVVIPTDSLDNPLKENTAVTIQQQFLSEEKAAAILTNNLIAYKKIYSPLKSGRILLSSASLGLNSKEYSVNIMPAISTNFKIFAKRNHQYADGNQITTFSTSVIKDNNNNIISDGSFVDFFIKNKKGNILKTSGKTINGVGFAKITHPEYEDKWSVKAYIIGMSESNTIALSFKKVIENFTVKFSNNNRELKVGPLQSFMNQMIPDGLKVTLTISKDGKLIDTIVQKSINGFVNFNLDANIYKNKTYNLVVSVAGIKQFFNSKKLW